MNCPKCQGPWPPTALNVDHAPSCKRYKPEARPKHRSPARAILAAPARLIVLVTGGRDYRGTGLAAKLDQLAPTIVYLVLGDARGADALAFEWATRERARRSDGLPIRRRHDAHWDRLGRRAGPERNGRMVADAVALRERTGLPVLCLAAPGDIGTADCARQAARAGIEVRRTA